MCTVGWNETVDSARRNGKSPLRQECGEGADSCTLPNQSLVPVPSKHARERELRKHACAPSFSPRCWRRDGSDGGGGGGYDDDTQRSGSRHHDRLSDTSAVFVFVNEQLFCPGAGRTLPARLLQSRAVQTRWHVSVRCGVRRRRRLLPANVSLQLGLGEQSLVFKQCTRVDGMRQ